MKNKILPLFLIFAILITGGGLKKLIVEADDATTSVEVGNTVPAFTSTFEPHEDPASATSTPTNVGLDVTFKAKASDANSDDWKLLICTSGSVTGTSCTASAWCTSNFASSTAEATCSHTALVGETETEAWYGFACDSVGCSAESHKTEADIGPPFHVNHSPAFTVFADDGPKGPATTITWSTTASDPDSGGSDTISLYVCKLADFTGTVCGVGGTWCSSIADADGDPTCNETTPRPDGDYAAYGYVLDSHSFVSVDTAEGTNSSPTVTNSSPSISASSINLLDTDGSGYLELNSEQAETSGFKVTFIVADDNSCLTTSSADEITSALINVRMSEITQANCVASSTYDANNCYPDASDWNPVCAASSTVDSCTGNTDTSVGWACTFPLQYHTDPTATSTPKVAYNWVAAAKATDDDTATSTLTDSTTYSNEMDKFMSYDLASTTLAYGSVSPNADSLEKTTTVIATGNVGLDDNLSGGNAASKGMCVTDYPTCSGAYIGIGQQKYNLTSALGWEGAGATALAYSPAESELNCSKTTVTGSPATKDTYWYLRVPTGQAVGTYTGQNTIEGKVDNETYGS
jgi:hypothetical protein